MKKYFLQITGCKNLILLLLLSISGCTNKSVKFQPLKLSQGKSNELIPAPELVTLDFLNRVKIVLEFYNEPFETDHNGNIIISESLANDKELIWNYTNKALDKNFITKDIIHIDK